MTPCSMLDQRRADADGRPLLDGGQNSVYSVQLEDKDPGEVKRESKASLPFTILLATILTGLWRPVCTSTDVDSKDTNVDDRNSGGMKADDDDSRKNVDDIKEEDVMANAEHWSVEKIELPRSVKPTLALCCNEVIFLVILAFFTSWLVYNLQTYLSETWGKQEYALDVVTYCCFICQMIMVVAYALMNRLRFCTRMLAGGKGGGSIYPFDMGFIRNRVSIILAESTTSRTYVSTLNLRRFAIFLLLPLTNTVIKTTFSLLVWHSLCEVGLGHFNDFISAASFIPYGCFWYLVYVERVSLHCQFNRAFRELRRAARYDDIDGARRLIDRIYAEYYAIRKTTSRWIAVTMVTVPVMLTYLATFTYSYDWSHSQMKTKVHWIFGLLFVQGMMFSTLPFFSLRGVNLKYMWREFCHVICKAKRQQQISFWLETEHYAIEIDTLEGLELKLSIIFPIFGIVVSRALASNHNLFEYWSHQYECFNVTAVSPSVPIG
ncbi:uncharacterized protein [Diadema setosum]|uniref:uncharacterized protein n=1 Tax=Diadema setosum TaxID=31175 RepID=UPI003B3AFC7D